MGRGVEQAVRGVRYAWETRGRKGKLYGNGERDGGDGGWLVVLSSANTSASPDPGPRLALPHPRPLPTDLTTTRSVACS